jgi:hypothetical protein
MAKPIAFDVQRMIAEVAARHRLLLKPDDAAFAIVTMNRMVLEESLEAIHSRVLEDLTLFQDAAKQSQVRAESALARGGRTVGGGNPEGDHSGYRGRAPPCLQHRSTGQRSLSEADVRPEVHARDAGGFAVDRAGDSSWPIEHSLVARLEENRDGNRESHAYPRAIIPPTARSFEIAAFARASPSRSKQPINSILFLVIPS